VKGVGIVISERLVGLWFMRLDERSDYMGALESLPEGGFRFKYRFRYNDPRPGATQDPFSPQNKDVKHWFTVTMSRETPKVKAIEGIQILIRALELKSGQQATELLMRNGDVRAFMAEFRQQPWANVKVEGEANPKTASG